MVQFKVERMSDGKTIHKDIKQKKVAELKARALSDEFNDVYQVKAYHYA